MSLRKFVYEKLTDFSSLVTNPLSTSKFLDEGVLTPEEFVNAGDLLVLKCPSWSWRPSHGKTNQKGLPTDKQYLITNNVPSMMRRSDLEAKLNTIENKQVELDDGEGGWVATHSNETPQNEYIPEIMTEQKNEEDGNSDDDDVPEINLDDLSFSETTEDKATLSTNDNIEKRRTYDISICYDQYHQTPKVWLFGYDENRQPLKPEEVLQDISVDHANKTVTIAAHPHTGIPQAYIHPCKHAEVMKKIVQRMKESGKTARVDQYLFTFLKFIHAAIPTIEYDYTTDMELQ